MVEDDLEPLITKCPNCSTQFRVTESQLAVAGGRVRCGACLTVFQGTEHLLLDEVSEFATGREADAALDELLSELDGPVSATEAAQSMHPAVDPPEGPRQLYGGFEDDEPLPEHGVSEDVGVAEDVGAAEPMDAADEASAEAVSDMADLAQQLQGADSDSESAAELEALAESVGSNEQDSDEWFEVDFDDWADSAAADSAEDEREATHSEFREEAGRWLDGMVADAPDSAAPREEQDREGVTAPGPEPSPAAEAEPRTHATPEPHATADVSQASAAGLVQVEAESEARPGKALPAVALLADEPDAAEISFAREPRRWWVGGLALVLLTVLALQIFYFQLPSWSLDPGLRPLYEASCRWFGCELPAMRDIDGLQTRTLVVRSHPELSGALVVDVVIVNRAVFEQAFPRLELRFTAMDGQLVASRQFEPQEYLAGELVGARLMPRDTPVQVSLEIRDPGPDAVNYTLRFR